LPRRLLALLIVLFAFPATARADWVPAVPIDGPNADVVSVGNVDIARDGAGAVAYLRKEVGVPHAFVQRLFGGAWRGPERIDPIDPEATEVKVAVGDDNRIVVAWIGGGNVYGNVVQGGGTTPGPWTGPVQLGGPDAHNIDIDMGVNGAAYLVWEQQGDVHAARLQDSSWALLPGAVDVEQPVEAGTGALRPKVAVSAEGYAVVTWGDVGAGRTRVWARRLTGLTPSVTPQLLSLDSGGASDSPDIDIEDDGSFAWVVFRQDLNGGSHTVGRRLIGSAFEAPEQIDGGVPSAAPKVDMGGAGRGYGVAEAAGGTAVMGSWLDHDHFQTPGRIDGADSPTPTKPEIAAGDRGDLAIAWRTGTLGGQVARARFKAVDSNLGPEFNISRPEYGPVADPGVYIGGDRVGDFAVAMVQGIEGSKALTVAVYDSRPGAPFIESSQSYKRITRPELRWRAGIDLWGSQTFRVYVDGKIVGQTTSDTLVPATPLTTGKHTWMVEAVDRAGQTSRSRTRTLRIDSTPPTIKISVAGKRSAGQALKVSVRATDRGGSGMDHVTVNYGDKSALTQTVTTRHRYKRGTYTLKVAAVDKAGNVGRKTMKLRIKK
jgi:hypothetical protein